MPIKKSQPVRSQKTHQHTPLKPLLYHAICFNTNFPSPRISSGCSWLEKRTISAICNTNKCRVRLRMKGGLPNLVQESHAYLKLLASLPISLVLLTSLNRLSENSKIFHKPDTLCIKSSFQ